MGVYLTYLISCRFLPPPPDGANPDVKIQWETVVATHSSLSSVCLVALRTYVMFGVWLWVLQQKVTMLDRPLPQDQRGCGTADAHEQKPLMTRSQPFRFRSFMNMFGVFGSTGRRAA